MISTLAIGNYRSLLKLVVPLGWLNVVTGRNGSGKSNLFRVLRLLADTAQGGIVHSLAREGGMASTLWAGPEKLSRGMKAGRVPIQGGPRSEPVRLRLGFADETFGYAITLGLPPPSDTAFGLDPEIKSEAIWTGPVYEARRLLVDRRGALVKVRGDAGWQTVSEQLNGFESIFSQVADPQTAPEILGLRETIRGWRFYDQFRTDAESAIRLPQLGTRTMVLHHDGHDLAAALQTILEIGDGPSLKRAIKDAFPGAQLEIGALAGSRLELRLKQHGLLRPLTAQELSDGTLRYPCWIAALLSPSPPSLMVLNEPENSLHPDLIPALARLIEHAGSRSQVWIVTHSEALVVALSKGGECNLLGLEKEAGETRIRGQDPLNMPVWKWPD